MKMKSHMVWVVSLMLMLSSCAYFRLHTGDTQRLILQSSEDMNESSPIRVDLVMTTDEETAGLLKNMTAESYFASRNQLVSDHPHQVMVVSWEMVPGQRIEELLTPGNHAPFTGVIFADYRLKGAHRAPLPSQGDVAILLHRSDLTVESLG